MAESIFQTCSWKARGAAANGAIVGAARGALVGSGAGIPLAFGVDFAAGMAGSLAEQKITGERISPVRAAVDGAFNAAGGRLYGTSPLRNAKDAFIRGALEGAVKGGAYNIADVLDNKLRNAYGSGSRRNPGTRTPWNKDNRSPWNSRTPRPIGSRCPQSDCIRPKPLKGMRNPRRRGSGNNSRNNAHRNDRFSLGSFVRDVVSGAVMGGLASVAFYGTGKAVEALNRSIFNKRENLRAAGKYIDKYGYRYDKVSDYLYGDKFIVEGDPFMYSMKNRNGGTIVVSTKEITGKSFINTIDFYNQQSQKIDIISGTHGTPDGKSAFGANWFRKKMNASLADRRFYEDDIVTASRYNNVEVYNMISLSTTELKYLLNSCNVTICAWCFSERSRDVINAIK